MIHRELGRLLLVQSSQVTLDELNIKFRGWTTQPNRQKEKYAVDFRPEEHS